jgi:predicted Zn finger-like uncharacterized protein
MIVTCQECESSFNINDEIIKETGSKVKCSKCENVFVVYPEVESGEADFEAPLAAFAQDDDDLDFAQEDESDDDLGLPDLDSMFEEDQESDVADLSDDLDIDIGGDLEADDLDLDIGEDLEAEDILSELDESAETDLPDIDTMMDFDEDSDAEAPGEDIDEELELDLDEGLGIDDIDEPEELGAETDETELDMLDAESLLDEDGALEAEDT